MQILYYHNEDIIVALLLCCDVCTILRVEQVCDQNRPSLVYHLTDSSTILEASHRLTISG